MSQFLSLKKIEAGGLTWLALYQQHAEALEAIQKVNIAQGSCDYDVVVFSSAKQLFYTLSKNANPLEKIISETIEVENSTDLRLSLIGILKALEKIPAKASLRVRMSHNKTKYHVETHLAALIANKRLCPLNPKNKKNPITNMELGVALLLQNIEKPIQFYQDSSPLLSVIDVKKENWIQMFDVGAKPLPPPTPKPAPVQAQEPAETETAIIPSQPMPTPASASRRSKKTAASQDDKPVVPEKPISLDQPKTIEEVKAFVQDIAFDEVPATAAMDIQPANVQGLCFRIQKCDEEKRRKLIQFLADYQLLDWHEE